MADHQLHKGPRLAEGRTAELFAWGDDQVLKLFRNNWLDGGGARGPDSRGWPMPMASERPGV